MSLYPSAIFEKDTIIGWKELRGCSGYQQNEDRYFAEGHNGVFSAEHRVDSQADVGVAMGRCKLLHSHFKDHMSMPF